MIRRRQFNGQRRRPQRGVCRYHASNSGPRAIARASTPAVRQDRVLQRHLAQDIHPGRGSVRPSDLAPAGIVEESCAHSEPLCAGGRWMRKYQPTGPGAHRSVPSTRRDPIASSAPAEVPARAVTGRNPWSLQNTMSHRPGPQPTMPHPRPQYEGRLPKARRVPARCAGRSCVMTIDHPLMEGCPHGAGVLSQPGEQAIAL